MLTDPRTKLFITERGFTGWEDRTALLVLAARKTSR